jgi:hypothetical protein
MAGVIRPALFFRNVSGAAFIEDHSFCLRPPGESPCGGQIDRLEMLIDGGGKASARSS